MLRLCADAVTLGSSGTERDQYFVMTADIFSENVQAESNRMVIDGGGAPGSGVSLTTSSEGPFSFSDNLAECDGNARALRSGYQRHHGSRPERRPYRSRRVIMSTLGDAVGFFGPNPMYG
jgi:hypothetical protein